MKHIGLLLSEALAPYQVTLDRHDSAGQFNLLVFDQSSQPVVQRCVMLSELLEQRLLIDLVDGLQRDLRIVEGRLQPSVIAALQQVQNLRGQVVGL